MLKMFIAIGVGAFLLYFALAALVLGITMICLIFAPLLPRGSRRSVDRFTDALYDGITKFEHIATSMFFASGFLLFFGHLVVPELKSAVSADRVSAQIVDVVRGCDIDAHCGPVVVVEWLDAAGHERRREIEADNEIGAPNNFAGYRIGDIVLLHVSPGDSDHVRKPMHPALILFLLACCSVFVLILRELIRTPLGKHREAFREAPPFRRGGETSLPRANPEQIRDRLSSR